MEIKMKSIRFNEVKTVVTNAVNNNMKNILFVSKSSDYSEISEWFVENPMYEEVRILPSEMLTKDQDGILRKCEHTCGIYEDVLYLLNKETSILLLSYFCDENYYRIDKIFDIIKKREYTNIFPNGYTQKHNLEKLKLVIAITAPTGVCSLNPNYYEFFDEVYLLDI
jgi:hypothetical protein